MESKQDIEWCKTPDHIRREVSKHSCGCGKTLYVARNKQGDVIGVTHLDDDEDHHYSHTSEMINAIKNNSN